MIFNNNIKIGDKFTKGKHAICIVTDIVKTFSTLRNEWNTDLIYLAKCTNGLSTNTFEVYKSSIVRNRIND